MLEKTYYSSGKNEFKNNVFSWHEWSAPTMVSPVEIRELLSSFKLEGRKVRRLKIVGMAYNLSRVWIENRAYMFHSELEEEERQKRSQYDNIASEVSFCRYVEIDEPLMIEFDDGDRFEIETPQEPEFSISMNCIPWDIEAGTNDQNVDANIIFAPCIGKTVISADVETYMTDKDPMFGFPFDEKHSKKELVSSVILSFEDGSDIRIAGWTDYCTVALFNGEGENDEILFGELKPALFNWEDMHTDKLTGYEVNNNEFFFGKLGARHTERPYITLMPGDKDITLNIAVDDFLLFDWSITNYMKKQFNGYENHVFTKKQWEKILEEAEKLFSFPTFDDLFEYMCGLTFKGSGLFGKRKRHIALDNINQRGLEFWNDIDKYRNHLQDMREWSELTLSASDKMLIRGA